MFKKSLILGIGFLFVFISFLYAQDAAEQNIITIQDDRDKQEEIGITAYYPSPNGAYKVLRLVPNNNIIPGSNCSNDGEMAYAAIDNKIYVCSQGLWEVAGGDLFWAIGQGDNADDIHNTNSGNVGVGTQTPDATLDVAGTIRIRGGNPAPSTYLTSDPQGNAQWGSIQLPAGSECVQVKSYTPVACQNCFRSMQAFCPAGYTLFSGGGSCGGYNQWLDGQFPLDNGWQVICQGLGCGGTNNCGVDLTNSFAVANCCRTTQ
jgi:hypothetical protein